jgi:peroxin-16
MYKQATQKTGAVLSMPVGWLGMYSDFITKNSSAVTQIESALRSLTYIIPGARRAPSYSGVKTNDSRPLPRV